MKPRKYCGFEIGEIALWQLLYLSCGEATNACIAESTSVRIVFKTTKFNWFHLATNKRQGVTISNVASIDDSEMKRLEAEAEANRESDRNFLDKAETVNEVEAAVYAAETLLRDLPKSVDTTLVWELKDSIKKIREASKTEDTARMRLIKQDLEAKMYTIAKKMYS
jgi:molecular chaperone DnaK (HSP70)